MMQNPNKKIVLAQYPYARAYLSPLFNGWRIEKYANIVDVFPYPLSKWSKTSSDAWKDAADKINENLVERLSE